MKPPSFGCQRRTSTADGGITMRLSRQIFPALLLAASASLAHAQFGGAFGRGGGMGGGPPDRPEAGLARRSVSASGAHLIADEERQLDNVRYQLRLRPDQEPAWIAYQERVGAMVADQLRPKLPDTADKALAPQQIDRKVDVVRNRLAALEEIADAARRLYAGLDPGQRALADRLLPATVPALYSGIAAGEAGDDRADGPTGGSGGRPARGRPPD